MQINTIHEKIEIDFTYQPRCKFYKIVIAHCLDVIDNNPDVETIEIKGLKLFADDLHVIESKAPVFKKRIEGSTLKCIRIWDQYKSKNIDILL